MSQYRSAYPGSSEYVKSISAYSQEKAQAKQEQQIQQQQLKVQQQQQHTQQLLVIGGLSLGAVLVLVISTYLLTRAFKRKDAKSDRKTTKKLGNMPRLNRSTYFLSSLVSTVIIAGLLGILELAVFTAIPAEQRSLRSLQHTNGTPASGLLLGILAIALTIIVLVCTVIYFVYQFKITKKRLHDFNASAWWMLALPTVIIFVGLIEVFILVFKKGNEKPNKYGSPQLSAWRIYPFGLQ